MKKLILASNNAKKLKELKAILSDMDVEILSQREAGCNFEVDETGTTFAENAYLKAKAVFDATGEATVADDSGLMVDALNGEPGVYSARYAPGGHDASDKKKYNVSFIEARGRDRPQGKNSCPAYAVCCPTERKYAPRANAADRYSQSPTARAASATIRFSCPTDIPTAWPCLAAR